jgi:S-(hydroxymethyl)glutathione dehydrogenase/alcohol dehydrogenase
MKALLFRPGHGSPGLEDLDIDSPQEHEVLVRIVACGICHSDLHFMESRNATGRVGLYGVPLNARMQPGPARRRRLEAEADEIVMGHEPAGIVEAVGSGVTSVRAGDRVIAAALSHCGVCPQCVQGFPHLCIRLPMRHAGEKPRLSRRGKAVTQFANLGGFAEKILAHETSLVKIDEDIPFSSAAILGCSIATGVGAALNTAKVTPGSTVAVFGAGGIGLSVIQGARIAGAARIFAIDLFDSKLAMAKTMGSTDGINCTAIDAVEALSDATHGAGVDFSFDTTASADVAQAAFRCLGLRGCLTCLAATPRDLSGLIWSEQRVIGSMLGSTRLGVDIPRYIELYRQGRLKLDEMVSMEISPDRFETAVAAINGGQAARTVIRFDTC